MTRRCVIVFDHIFKNHAIGKETNIAQKQQQRKDEENLRNIRSCAYKVGSVLYSWKDRNPCKHLDTAPKCAESINRLFGVKVLSGRQLKNCVKQNRVAKLPPRVGKPSEIPDEEFNTLCDAFSSMGAINQNNVGEKQLDRPAETNLLDEIVKEKRKKNGLDDIWAVKLKERIDMHNAPRQGVKVVDERQKLWTLWCTKRSQLLHYEKPEEFLVEQGYAQVPKDNKERAEQGYVVLAKKSATLTWTK